MKRDTCQKMMSFLQLAAEKKASFFRAYRFSFGSSYFARALDISYLIKPKCGDRFTYFSCQIVSNMMHKSSQNQFGLVEKIKHQS